MSKPFRYSTISDAHKCMKYYELKHIQGMDDGLGKSGDIVFGTAVHQAMQDLYEGGNGLDVFHFFWQLQRDKALEYGRLGWDELSDMGAKLITYFADEHMHKFKPLHLERKMNGKIGRHHFQGTADFVGTFQSAKNAEPVLALVDWKTSAMPYDQYKIQVNEQLYGYVALAQQELGITIQHAVYGVAIKDPKGPRWQFKKTFISPEILTKMVGNIEAMCDHLSTAKTFYRNPSACVVGKRVCPFFSVCHSSGGANGGEEGEGT